LNAKQLDMHTIQGSGRATGFRFCVVVSKYNDFVTDRLQAGALAALAAAGVAPGDITLVRVPGAFEIPLAAQHAAESGRFDAIVCLGCLIRGETAHFEYISSAVSLGLTNAASSTGVPMAFGVLTTNSIEEALARAGEGAGNKGHEAAAAAIEMAEIVAQLTRQATPRT
jgi:6,7-dimethyl-8-ribityllumazine synthase